MEKTDAIDTADLQNTYVLNSESAAEMARLNVQDQLVTEAMGGLFPERTDLSSRTSVLDIGCGPGGWVLKVAQIYPHMRVVGIDISALMIAFASSEAIRLGLSNVQFIKMNALEPLQFSGVLFDIVNIRFAVAYVPRTCWPTLLQECYRITRPGGILRLTEADGLGLSNRPAFEEFNRRGAALLHRAGYGFSPDGQTLGMTPMLAQLLVEAGYEEIQTKLHQLNYSYGTPLYARQLRNVATLLEAYQTMSGPFRAMLETTSVEEERLKQRVLEEMEDPLFRAYMYCLTAWGERPVVEEIEGEQQSKKLRSKRDEEELYPPFFARHRPVRVRQWDTDRGVGGISAVGIIGCCFISKEGGM